MRARWAWAVAAAGCNLEPVDGASQAELDALADQVEALQAQLAALEADCVKDTDLDASIAAALAAADVLTTADLTGYATQAWVESQGYVSSLDGYATEAWVGQRGFLTADDLVDYALVQDLQAVAADLGVLDGRVGSSETAIIDLRATTLSTAEYGLLLDLLGYIEVGPLQVRFVGADVYIQNGMGRSDQANGLGNLILGYNEDPSGQLRRDASHSLVAGEALEYGGTGGAFIRQVVQADLFDGRSTGMFQTGGITVPLQAGQTVILSPPRSSAWLISGVSQVGGPIAADGVWQVTSSAQGQCEVIRLDGLARALMSCNLAGQVEVDRGGGRFNFIRLL